MTVQYLDNGNPDGAVLGQTASELVAFWGATPVAQPSGAAQAVVTFSVGWLVALTNTSGTTAYAFDTTAHAKSLFDLLVEIRSALVTVGLIKGAS